MPTSNRVTKIPKILIFGQPLNNYTGGGITLTNLFKGWPLDNIAGMYVNYGSCILSTDVCRTYYQLGREERMWEFPLNIVKHNYPSGLRPDDIKRRESTAYAKTGLTLMASRFLYLFFGWLGLNNCDSVIVISPKLERWLSEYKPEVLYLQVSTREGILFANHLLEYLKIPSAIHMMDDWPSTISEHGPFKRYWKTKIDREFRQLLNRVNIHLSISDAMSEEYFNRYQKRFTAFHNPVEIAPYSTPGKKENHVNNFRILYLGRIGTANKESIILFAKIISQLKIENKRVEFEIYSKDADLHDLKQISDMDNVIIKQPVPYHTVPGLLKEYDLLFLPLDFTVTGLKFARFSIPTKATEYMLSGTPVFVLAPEETAVSKFFKKNNCGYCITSPNEEEIIKGIQFLISNEEYRKQISINAMNLARAKFDATIVRQKFQNMLIDLSDKKIGVLPTV